LAPSSPPDYGRSENRDCEHRRPLRAPRPRRPWTCSRPVAYRRSDAVAAHAAAARVEEEDPSIRDARGGARTEGDRRLRKPSKPGSCAWSRRGGSGSARPTSEPSQPRARFRGQAGRSRTFPVRQRSGFRCSATRSSRHPKHTSSTHKRARRSTWTAGPRSSGGRRSPGWPCWRRSLVPH